MGLSGANHASLCKIREKISGVKLYSLLGREAMVPLGRAYLAEDAAEDSASTTAKMMLAESEKN